MPDSDTTPDDVQPHETDEVARLLGEFNDLLHSGESPDIETFVLRCPETERQELLSLINTLILADRALEPLRKLLEDLPQEEPDSRSDIEKGGGRRKGES